MSHYEDIRSADGIDQTVKDFYDVRNADIVQSLNSLDFYNDGICDVELSPVVPGHEIRGRALTVKILPKNSPKSNYRNHSAEYAEINPMNQNQGWKDDFGDVLHDFLNSTEPGDVICVDMEGEEYMLGGDHLSLKSLLRGAIGMVVDGGMRDTFGVREVNFPLWIRHIAQKEPVQEMELVAINEPISLGGVKVQPNDIICCDDDGVLVVPHQNEEEILTAAKDGIEMTKPCENRKSNSSSRRVLISTWTFRPRPSAGRSLPTSAASAIPSGRR